MSICTGGTQREKKLHLSKGNLLHIFLNHPDQRENNAKDAQFILRLQGLQTTLVLFWCYYLILTLKCEILYIDMLPCRTILDYITVNALACHIKPNSIIHSN